uniref:Cytochrome c oxidase subunit 2 n=1 Tax=Chytriomyces confervae TaxID=246404 RepID=A0A4V1F1W3_9FUNG|nr:cytochrome c oxidase subunit 2 [Chytriomyces confervae]QCQ69074.1 cytochrome c oxidase subunit 2 [Chytriomyces confervae]
MALSSIVPLAGISCDYPLNYALGFQDPASNFMYAIVDLHDRIIFFLIILLVIVAWTLISSLLNSDHMALLNHNNTIELIWTITPAGILWAIGLPSLNLLYLMDEVLDAEITVKAIGNQWYWSYEYTDYEAPIAFDSFMIDEASLEIGDQRQLEVDNSLVLPVNTSIRILVSSNDVIHSFAIPSLALKVDALPGRLNSLGLIINRPGQFYGQCSELCGANHGFMPISLKAVTIPSYINFLEANVEA